MRKKKKSDVGRANVVERRRKSDVSRWGHGKEGERRMGLMEKKRFTRARIRFGMWRPEGSNKTSARFGGVETKGEGKGGV